MEKNKEKPAENEEIEQKTEQPNYLEDLQRLQAEFSNFQKRTQKEKEEIKNYAKEGLILKLLEITDNFERAMDSIKGKDSEEAKGVSMIFSQFKNVLKEEGVNQIEAEGERFDPYVHEALAKEEGEEEENIVTEVFQKGYKYKDKVIRPAKVKVSGGKQK